MGSFADYLEDKTLDYILGGAAFTPAATLYVGLSTTTITDAGGNITEPSGNGYARMSVAQNQTNWPASSSGSISNGAAVTFPEATGAWGTVTDFFLSDASSGGNIYFWSALGTSKDVSNGDTLSFAIGDLTVSLT